MPRGDRSSYTEKKKRKAEDSGEGLRERGVSKVKRSGRAGRPSKRKETGGLQQERLRPRRQGHNVSAGRDKVKKGTDSAARARRPRPDAPQQRDPVRQAGRLRHGKP